MTFALPPHSPYSGGDGGGGGDDEEEDNKKGGSAKRCVRSVNQDHFRPCVSLQRSPFFPDIYLSVGDWSFNLWCEGVDAPVFSSPFSEAYLTSGQWSPTRPGVIVLSRADGVIDLWDLTDQSHKPSMSAPVASTQLTSMEFAQKGAASASAIQLLAAGDAGGNLHILEMPRAMRRPSANEKSAMRAFFDREVQRVQYVAQVQRERDAEGEGEDAPQQQSKEDEMSAKQKRKAAAEERKKLAAQLKKEEEEYRKLEARFREELGVGGSDSPGSGSSPGSAPGSPGSNAGSDGGFGKEASPRGEVDAEGVAVEMKAEKQEF